MRAAEGPRAEQLVGLMMSEGAGISGWVQAHREPVTDTDGRLDLAGVVDAAAVVPCLSEPLEVQGRRGTLTMYRLRDDGVALENARVRLESVLDRGELRHLTPSAKPA